MELVCGGEGRSSFPLCDDPKSQDETDPTPEPMTVIQARSAIGTRLAFMEEHGSTVATDVQTIMDMNIIVDIISRKT